MLRIEHVTKKYQNFTALSDVDLTLEHGVYGLLAPNGAGKTTLLKMLATLLFPTEGRILYNGREIQKLDERYRENKMRASLTANRFTLTVIFLATVFLGQGRLLGNLEHTLIAYVIVVSLALALDLFLGEYLLYHYDHDEPLDEGEA